MKAKSWLLGLGFDARDGHKRVTRGDNFYIFGGAQETHTFLEEKALKFNEHLKTRGKTLDDIGREEFYEIAERIGMKKPPGDRDN